MDLSEFRRQSERDRERELRSGYDRYSIYDLGAERPGVDDEFRRCPCGEFETMGGRPCAREADAKKLKEGK